MWFLKCITKVLPSEWALLPNSNSLSHFSFSHFLCPPSRIRILLTLVYYSRHHISVSCPPAVVRSLDSLQGGEAIYFAPPYSLEISLGVVTGPDGILLVQSHSWGSQSFVDNAAVLCGCSEDYCSPHMFTFNLGPVVGNDTLEINQI